MLSRFDRAEMVGRRAALGQIGRLEIGYVGSAAYAGVLQEQVRRFRQSHPDVDVHTRELAMEALPELVRIGEVDVGFVRLPMALPKGLSKRTLLRDHFCLALPPAHPLAQQALDPSPDQLAEEPLVVPEQPAGTDEVARRGGLVPRVVTRPGRWSAVLTEVSLGTGLSIVPSTVRDALRLPNVSFRELAGPPIPSEVAAIFRTDSTAIGKMLVDQLENLSDAA